LTEPGIVHVFLVDSIALDFLLFLCLGCFFRVGLVAEIVERIDKPTIELAVDFVKL
jgi:hypothetical protein